MSENKLPPFFHQEPFDGRLEIMNKLKLSTTTQGESDLWFSDVPYWIHDYLDVAMFYLIIDLRDAIRDVTKTTTT